MAPSMEAECTWIGKFWLASSQSDGYELYGAVVIPSDVFARPSVNLVMNDSQHSALTYRLFEGEEEAEAWLRQLP
ncbi:hypothetical protein [Hymenobacter sedentarius]|nr:hypothetical protein [Hymenobacter sedentarius]